MRRAVGVLLVFVVPLWAQPGAVLQVSGPVEVNGKSITRSAVLLDADAVQTFSSSAAITQKGANVLIGANSVVSYSQRGIRLSAGSATITANVPFSVRVERVTVQSAAPKTRFSVRETPCNIQIAALEGGVSVDDGGSAVVLDSGKSLSLPLLRAPVKVENGDAPNSVIAGSAAEINCNEGAAIVLPKAPVPTNVNLSFWGGSSVGSALLVLWITDRGQVPISPPGP